VRQESPNDPIRADVSGHGILVAKITVKYHVILLREHLHDHLPVKSAVKSAKITERSKIFRNKCTYYMKIVIVHGIRMK
jgi:hypothetical protein